MGSPDLLAGACGAECPTIAQALSRGGIRGEVSRGELQAMLRGLADSLPSGVASGEAWASRLPSGDGFEPDFTRERVAVLYPDRPILLPAIETMLWLFSLADPIEPGRGGPAIDKVFLILSSNIAGHEMLRARLKELMDLAAFRSLLTQSGSDEELLDRIRELESTLPIAVR